jgi:glycerol-3-phosphate cytidylyltransferase
VAKVIVIAGGFDPIHRGHIDCINCAGELGDILIVGVNSDEWLVRNKGQSFMPFEIRISNIQAIETVDYAVPYDDRDNTYIDLINWASRVFPNHTILFDEGTTNKINSIEDYTV